MIGAVSASQGWHATMSWFGRNLSKQPQIEFAGKARASARNLDGGLDRQRTAADALALEGLPQRQHHLALHIVHSFRVGDPEGQGKLHAGPEGMDNVKSEVM